MGPVASRESVWLVVREGWGGREGGGRDGRGGRESFSGCGDVCGSEDHTGDVGILYRALFSSAFLIRAAMNSRSKSLALRAQPLSESIWIGGSML